MEPHIAWKMYTSFFSYNISRPYPFPWFTPVALVGGIVLAVVFSIVNLAANGYYMKQIYTTDPNTTVKAKDAWFMKSPFNWGDSFHPSCEPRLLSVGDQFFTTNLGFNYEVTEISRYENEAQLSTSLASTPYLNNTLDDCRAEHIQVNLRKGDTTPISSWWISWSPTDSVTTVRCTIMGEAGPANITFQVGYSSGGASDTNYVINDNFTTRASVWWGTRLMNVYWIGLLSAMSQASFSDDSYWTRGSFDYLWNDTDKRNIRDLDFFNLQFFLLSSDSGVMNADTENLDNATMVAAMYNNPDYEFSPAMTEGLHFAKLMHSLVAVDLGNTALPNLLLNDEDLKYILDAPDDDNRRQGAILDGSILPGTDLYAKIPPPGALPSQNRTWLNETYDLFSQRTGPLGTRNATIYSQYICSIPARKSTGTMLLAILIADLVFLQVAWKLLNLTAENIVTRQGPTAMFCDGCAKGGYVGIDLQSFSGGRSDVRVENESTQDLISK